MDVAALISNNQIILVLLIVLGNVVELQNQMKGKMKATAKLMNTGEKKFPLDSISAPRIRYVQILDDGNNNKSLTFLNTYANAIYVYDYNTLGLKKIVKFSKKDKEGINVPLGTLDVTFYRDDFRTNLGSPKIGASNILFEILSNILLVI